MTADLVVKQHDTQPAAELTATDPDATFEQVASWRFLIRRGDTLFTDTTPDVVADDAATPHKAVLTHQWQAEETDTVGPMLVEAEATWPDGSIQTFPPDGYLTVAVAADLD